MIKEGVEGPRVRGEATYRQDRSDLPGKAEWLLKRSTLVRDGRTVG